MHFQHSHTSLARNHAYLAPPMDVLHLTGIILWMRPANERRRYNVTTSLMGWALWQIDPSSWVKIVWKALFISPPFSTKKSNVQVYSPYRGPVTQSFDVCVVVLTFVFGISALLMKEAPHCIDSLAQDCGISINGDAAVLNKAIDACYNFYNTYVRFINTMWNQI